MRNPYTVLDIHVDASTDEIKSAFRRLAKGTHPDLNGGNQELTNRFREVAEAYAILSDPEQKKFCDDLILNGDFMKENSSAYNGNARATAEDIEAYIHVLYKEIEPYKEAAMKSALIGLAWLCGGVFVTYATYQVAVANGGGSYFITWGAILFGGIQAIRGLSNYVKINSAVEEAEAEMWNTFK